MKHAPFRKRAGSGSMPYYVPMNRNRQRTKSESTNDAHAAPNRSDHDSMDCDDKGLIMDIEATPGHMHHVSSNPTFNKIKNSQLKKSKSLESLLLPFGKLPQEKEKLAAATASNTLEFPTLLNRIQRLKFNE
jgi:hypothetical protein